MKSPIISTEELASQLADENLVIADVRWAHGQPTFGRDAYLREHIPGAVCLDLETELSDISDKTKGRHPLPTPENFIAALTKAGIGKGKRMVCYDDTGGNVAARLWWMMQWIGQDCCQLLDGGIGKWISENRPLEHGVRQKIISKVVPFEIKTNPSLVVSYEEVASLAGKGFVLLDARSSERFSGAGEGIDWMAGHIPGSTNLFWKNNLESDTHPVFKSAEALKNQFAEMGITENTSVAASCGSGVTACHHLIALRLAGIRNTRLYVGSWSEWIERAKRLWPQSLDALSAAPDHHSLILENDQVRVLDTRILAGDRTPVHHHRWPSVLYILSWSNFIRYDDRGKILLDSRTLEKFKTPPTVVWSAPLPLHSLENTGETDLRVISVELKE